MGAYDLGELGPASVISGGLAGLLEAYKMKMGRDVEEAKMRQGAFNANANQNLGYERLGATIQNNLETQRQRQYALEHPKSASMSPTDEQINLVAADIASGKTPSKEYNSMIGRSSPTDRYRLYAAIKTANPNFDMSKNLLSFKKDEQRMAGIGSTEGRKGFATEASVGTLHDVLSRAQTYVPKLTPTGIAPVDSAIQRVKAAFNNKDAVALQVHMNEAQGIYSQILMGQGVPTDQARKMASDALTQGRSPAGFESMKNAAMFVGSSRADRLTGKIPVDGAPGPMSKPRAALPKAAGGSPPPGFEAHINKRTGETAYINPSTGEKWVP